MSWDLQPGDWLLVSGYVCGGPFVIHHDVTHQPPHLDLTVSEGSSDSLTRLRSRCGLGLLSLEAWRVHFHIHPLDYWQKALVSYHMGLSVGLLMTWLFFFHSE